MTSVEELLERWDTCVEHAQTSIDDIIPEVVESITHGDYDEAIDLIMEIKKCEMLMEVVEQVKNILKE